MMRKVCSSIILFAAFGLSTSSVQRGATVKESIVSHPEADDWEDCKFVFRDKNRIRVEYDLHEFQRKKYPFEVADSAGRNWLYYFNVCRKIPEAFYKNSEDKGHSEGVPTSCYNATGPCLKTKEDDFGQLQCDEYYDVKDELPYALQVHAEATEETGNKRHCHWLGAELPHSADYNMSLLDPLDSAKGVVLELLNGEWCASEQRNRILRIRFVCPDTGRFQVYAEDEMIITSEEVDEHPPCEYTLTYESALACPKQCLSKDKHKGKTRYSVCEARGICATDPNAAEVRCLCDEGFTGKTCNKKYSDSDTVSESHKGLLAAIIVCMILLLFVVASAAYVCFQIRAKEEDAHGSLGGHFFSPMLAEDELVATGDGLSMEQRGMAVATSLNAAQSKSEDFEVAVEVDVESSAKVESDPSAPKEHSADNDIEEMANEILDADAEEVLDNPDPDRL